MENRLPDVKKKLTLEEREPVYCFSRLKTLREGRPVQAARLLFFVKELSVNVLRGLKSQSWDRIIGRQRVPVIAAARSVSSKSISSHDSVFFGPFSAVESEFSPFGGSAPGEARLPGKPPIRPVFGAVYLLNVN